jgi:CxxC motif-containing protein (DUF1111 family)
LLLGLALISSTLGCHNDDDDSSTEISAVGDEPVVATHLDQAAIVAGSVAIDDVIDHGRALFAANFNTLDGAARPEATGTGAARPRREFPQNFNRVSAPDANSCAGCHNLPRLGGGGDNVANVFVLGQALPFVNFDQGAGDNFVDHTLETVANERNTLGMFGAGFIELVAREMTTALQAIRTEALAQAALGDGESGITLPLVAKGVDFGTITAFSDGSLDTSGIEGVNTDLVVRPFHQKGVVVSLREFSNNAMNHHHGMQSVERFGANADHDQDGRTNELTVGDITAVTLWQATLPAPGRAMPNSSAALAAVTQGEALFTSFGCAVCHVPELLLDSPLFSEPNPFNPAGNAQVADGPTLEIDLTEVGPGPHLPKRADGAVIVRAFTDLKRHDMGVTLDNEQKVQGGVPTEFFLTRKLWGMANEPPFMHHGRALTIDEAILMHGGESQAARDLYATASVDEQQAVVEFLKTLQLLPETATSTEILVPASGIIGDEPAVLTHVDQGDIDAGDYSADTLFQLGKVLFNANFNTLDGAGRPATTGTGAVRDPEVAPHNFNRLSGPDANSCAGCHNVPRSGGGGDNVANVFVLAQALPFVNFDGDEGDGFADHSLEGVANERNTLGMFGAGFVELLAREITVELQAQRAQAIADATLAAADVSIDLTSKGVSFGSLIAHANGSTDTSGVEGIDTDLVLRPFHQKGVVVSLRVFSNNAMNHHHGIQSAERFGDLVDHDQDGMSNELTVGDMTATALYQALLPVPGRVFPADPAERASVDRGELLFDQVGCAVCHVPTLRLDSAVFSEPNPFNPAGNLQVSGVPAPFSVDLTAAGPGPHLSKELDGSVLVPAYTDLKRHDMGVELDNEEIVQAGVPTNQFLTKKLWGFASEPPFLHHGRALTIDEAIQKHGGEAASSRAAYNALSGQDRDSVIDFLKTLQTVPEDSPLEIVK